MSGGLFFLVLAALAAAAYLAGRWRATAAVGGDTTELHSRTGYHGLATGMGALLAGLATYVLLHLLATLVPPLGHPWVVGLAPIVLAVAAFLAVYLRITPAFRARNLVETMTLGLLILAASIAIFTTAAIVLSLLFETANFFSQYSWHRVLLRHRLVAGLPGQQPARDAAAALGHALRQLHRARRRGAGRALHRHLPDPVRLAPASARRRSRRSRSSPASRPSSTASSRSSPSARSCATGSPSRRASAPPPPR